MKTRTAGRIAWIASGLVHLLILVGFWHFGEHRAHREVPELPTVAEKEEHPMVLSFVKDEESQSITVPVPAEVKPVVAEAFTPKAPDKPLAVVDVANLVQPAKYEESRPAMPVPIPVRPPAGGPVFSPAAIRFAEGKVLHGLLPDGRRAVYLLDRSASMGLVRETFEAARAAMFATINGTRSGASFQALVYNSDVTTLLGSQRNAWLKMDADIPTKLRRALAALEPEGRSLHEVALRTAIAQEPDYIIWTTDAADGELAALKPILRSARKPVAVYLCRAVGGKVEAPVEWK
jgi:hypothetical protein